MMNTRTRKPAARTASGITSQYDKDRQRYIRYHRPAYGTSVLTICQTPRPTEGFWYRATTSFQADLSACGRSLEAPVLFVIINHFLRNHQKLEDQVLETYRLR